jgi:hypothetical protein
LKLVPDVAGKPSRLEVDVSPQQVGAPSEPAQSVVLAIARGFVIDPRRVGRGTVEGNASGLLVPGGSQDFTATIDLFIAGPPQPGDIAGLVAQASEPRTGLRGTATGRLVRVAQGAFGTELRFDQLPGVQRPPPGVTITVKRVRLAIGASRRVRKVRIKKRRVRTRRGTVVRRRRLVKRIRYHLIRNPRTCAGSWPYQVRVGFPSGEQVRDGSVPCRGRG